MLIKIKESKLEIVNHSLNSFESDYIQFMKFPAGVDIETGEHLTTLTGEPEKLYKMLFFISKSCDIEIM